MWVCLSLLVFVVGTLTYALSANPKIAEIGRLCLFAGILAFLLQADKLVGLFR
jgi:Na+/phosphate symporter